MNEQIKSILAKKVQDISAEETCILDEWLMEASNHDCENDPSDRHCSICFYAVKASKKLGEIEQVDELRELDIESSLLEKLGEQAVSW